MPLAAIWIDLEIILLHEVRQIKISYDITYMWNLKNSTSELIYRTKSHKCRKQIYGYQGEEMERDNLGD